MRRHIAWLTAEISQWQHDGLIDEATATALRSRYPAEAVRSWGLYLITAIGSVVFGLGVVLFFAYNWAGFSRAGKLALVFFAVLLAHGTAIWLSRRQPPPRSLVEGFHLLGSMMFGAGIWLIAQIYNMDEHYPTAFLVWGLGSLAMAWAMPSVVQGLLAAVLLGTWGFMETVDFNSTHPASIGLFAVGIVPLAWSLRSQTLLLVGIVAVIGLSLANAGSYVSYWILFTLLFCTGLLLIAAAYPIRLSSFPGSASVLRDAGVILYGIQLFMLSFVSDALLRGGLLPATGHASSWMVPSILWVSLGITGAAWIVLLKPGIRERFTPGHCTSRTLQHLLILASLLVLVIYNLGWFGTSLFLMHIAFNMILAAHGILLIIRGTDDLKWTQVAMGFLTLGVLILVRFNDLFSSLLMRSLAFIIIGVVLFLIGHQYSRRRMKEQAHA